MEIPSTLLSVKTTKMLIQIHHLCLQCLKKTKLRAASKLRVSKILKICNLVIVFAVKLVIAKNWLMGRKLCKETDVCNTEYFVYLSSPLLKGELSMKLSISF